MIKFTDINSDNQESLNIKKKINNLLYKKDFILGSEVSKFEKSFSKFENFKYGVGCNSGTDALLLALKYFSLKDNEEILISGFSYASTYFCAENYEKKLKIKFCDIDINNGLISFEDFKKKISKKTKLLIVINLYGQKCNLKKIIDFKKKKNLKFKIIEDSAQSHGAYSCYLCTKKLDDKCCKNKKYNTSDISCYSFYPTKNLGAYGDGGMVCTNNKKIYNKIKILRNVGSVKKNIHKLIGICSRLDTLQAGILNIKLKNLEKNNDRRRMIANIYNQNLKNLKKISLIKTLPGSNYHLYVIKVKKRLKFINFMNKNKISTSIHYPYTLNKLIKSQKIINKNQLKNAFEFSKTCVSLPMYPEIKISTIKRICNTIKLFK
jgi:dTDP-4-amino-4,6-dideoxygalactose transaminase